MYIKEELKKNEGFMRIYDKVLPHYCVMFPKSAIKLLYKQTFQRKLDLNNPKDLNEKIQWLKVYKYGKDPLVIQCADKFAVREYVEQRNCSEILNDIYASYNNVDEIDWDKLPNSFALKFNKAAGMNIICDDKSKLDKIETLNKVRSWFTAVTGESSGELHYGKAPAKLVCEKYIPSLKKLPIDYKVFCLNGKPYLTMVCLERETKTKYIFMDTEWQRVYIDTPNYPDDIVPPKPKSYSEMLEYAEILSKPFPLVRVDFYELDGKPIFGELTFTPFGGYIVCMNQKGLDEAGKLLKLPKR